MTTSHARELLRVEQGKSEPNSTIIELCEAVIGFEKENDALIAQAGRDACEITELKAKLEKERRMYNPMRQRYHCIDDFNAANEPDRVERIKELAESYTAVWKAHIGALARSMGEEEAAENLRKVGDAFVKELFMCYLPSDVADAFSARLGLQKVKDALRHAEALEWLDMEAIDHLGNWCDDEHAQTLLSLINSTPN